MLAPVVVMLKDVVHVVKREVTMIYGALGRGGRGTIGWNRRWPPIGKDDNDVYERCMGNNEV